MNYSDINAATAHHINGDLPLASHYYNKIFKRISGPPPWLLRNLYKAFEEVETPRGSFLRYNPRWNDTIEEIVPLLQPPVTQQLQSPPSTPDQTSCAPAVVATTVAPPTPPSTTL